MDQQHASAPSSDLLLRAIVFALIGAAVAAALGMIWLPMGIGATAVAVGSARVGVSIWRRFFAAAIAALIVGAVAFFGGTLGLAIATFIGLLYEALHAHAPHAA